LIYKKPIKYEQGFTLIEVVIAISIFAMLGFASYKVVHGLSLARDSITKNSEDLRWFVRAMNVVNRDLTQLTPRKIIDESGKTIAAFDTHGDYLVEFTRVGVPNPLMVKRAKVARVAYRFSQELDSEELKQIEKNELVLKAVGDGKQGYLLRYVWPVLDRGNKDAPQMQVVLAGVNNLEFEYLEDKDKWNDEWPPTNDTGGSSVTDLPYAIKLKINTKKYGLLERFFQIRTLPVK
jgi:general secretion pathway protein J